VKVVGSSDATGSNFQFSPSVKIQPKKILNEKLTFCLDFVLPFLRYSILPVEQLERDVEDL